MSDLKELQQRLGYTFKEGDLLYKALSHRSCGADNNERLEFLGDAVLSAIIAEELYTRQPQAREGELSRMRAILVNGEMLASMAKSFDIGTYLHLGVGEQKSGGQFRQSILADALEALIGAIYLDGGIDPLRMCLLRWYAEHFEDFADLLPEKDAKSILQEWLQARKLPLPEYQAKASGVAHAQTFRVTCRVEGLAHVTEGESTSRRKAEQQAAQRFLDLIHE